MSWAKNRTVQRFFIIGFCEAVKDGDTNRLARLAHNLRGVSLDLSVNRLATLALNLEEISRREDLTSAPALATQLEEEARQVEEYPSRNGM